MIRAQRRMHRFLWLLLAPVLLGILWLAAESTTPAPGQALPHASDEALLP